MPHTFGCAADSYRRGVHPRILVGPTDIARLRKLVRTGDGKKIFAAIRKKIAPVVDHLLAADTPEKLDALHDPSLSWASFGTTVDNTIHDMAMVAVLADDQRAFQAASKMFVDATSPKRGGYFGYHAYAYDLLHDQLPADVRLHYTREVIATAQKLIAPEERGYYAIAGLNGVLVQMFIALHLVLAVRGDEGAPPDVVEPLLAKLVRYLRASMNTAICVDGYPEEDVGYGTSVTASLAKISHAVFRAGLWDAYTDCPRLLKAGRAFLHFVQPWGVHLAATGDYGGASCDHRENLLVRLAHVNRDPSLLWLLGTLHNDNTLLKKRPGERLQGEVEVPLKKGYQVPATADMLAVLDILGKSKTPAQCKVPTAFRDTGRGIVSFRDKWADDGTFVVFDGAQRGTAAPGHHHMSSGHFSLTAIGEYFAIDMNRYGTEQTEHNVTLVDGKSGRSTNGQWGTVEYTGAQLIRYEPGTIVDWAGADSSLQHDCFWARRHVLFVKGAGVHPYLVTIDDINKANDWREFWWTLNTSPENTITIREQGASSHASIKGWRKGNHLDVHFALPSASEFPKPHTLNVSQDERTTSSYDYIKNPHERAAEYVRPAAMVEGIVFVRPRLVAKVAGYNGRFLAAMLPRKNGEKPAKVERLPSLGSSLALRIAWPKFEDTIIWAYEHCLLEAGDVRGVGQWCVVRRALPSGRILHHAMGEGTRLEVAGKRLI